MKLYVGNLSFETTENDLQDLFEQHGQVSEVALMMDRMTGKSRGFAFVTMNDKAQAEAAMAALNGKEVGGRTLNVNEARGEPVTLYGRNRWNRVPPTTRDHYGLASNRVFRRALLSAPSRRNYSSGRRAAWYLADREKLPQAYLRRHGPAPRTFRAKSRQPTQRPIAARTPGCSRRRARPWRWSAGTGDFGQARCRSNGRRSRSGFSAPVSAT